jgi:SHS2 domain-containing protein
MSPYREVEHTADWALRVWAPTLEGLFVDAARGMYALAGARAAPRAGERHTVECQADDYETLLVGWLQEWLFRTEMHNLVFEAFQIDRLTPTELSGSAVGRPAEHLDKLIKAVTYHNLKIEPTAEGFETTIVVDV